MDESSSIVVPLYRHAFDASRLAEHPPRFHEANKIAVYRHACPDGPQRSGAVAVTRWDAMPLPGRLPVDAGFELVPMTGVFRYAPPALGAIDWHLNFAADDLFGAYAGQLLAQDELQVLEHPALGSVRELLEELGASTTVTTRDGRPTPILVRGVERRCALDTAPGDRRPYGLYGNSFACAEPEQVFDALEVLDPPTVSNIIAIEAPSYGKGSYAAEEIHRVLTAAYSGFRAAMFESASSDGHTDRVTIHTGFWGCGAYGGNRVLMSAAQILAARLAAVDRLAFFAFDETGKSVLDEAVRAAARAAARGGVNDAIEWLADQRYEWGVSDGT